MNSRTAIPVLAAAFFACTAASAAPPTATATAGLAAELAAEGHWDAAALEYRRLALDDPQNAPVWRWMAAWAYAKSPDARVRHRADAQLDAAEDADGDFSLADQIQALRAQLALAGGAPAEARFHFEGLAADSRDESLARWARRGTAAAFLRTGDPARARDALGGDPEGLAALSACAPVPRKRPWLGGVLGLVPGLGYAYSGEWANATRSLLLNALFLWAMAETADEDQWALFGVSAFFEITWYSGSVYGGIDAAHRWNARRLDEAERALRGPSSMPEPVLHRLPLLEIRFP